MAAGGSPMRLVPRPGRADQGFLRLRRISARQMTACLEIVQACVSEVRLSGLQATSRRDDAELLQSYIDTHYAQALTHRHCRGAERGQDQAVYGLQGAFSAHAHAAGHLPEDAGGHGPAF